MSAGAVSSTNSFVGRERELGELRCALDDVSNGRGRLFLISGEPGIGKTRLAEEIATDAISRGMQVVWGRCWEGGGAPAYWPWVQILRSLIVESNRVRAPSPVIAPEISQLIPELSSEIQRPLPSDPQEARSRLFDAVATIVKELSRTRPLILILDDMHHADQSSLSLLRFAARELRDTRSTILSAYREVDVERSPGLSSIVGELAREGRQMPLRGLSASEVAGFVQDRAGVALSPDLVATIVEATAGNPLFLDGVLSTLLADGKLSRSDQVRASDLRLPAGIQITIREQLDRLPASAQLVLPVASAFGNEFQFEMLRAALKIDAKQLDAVLKGLIRSGLVIGSAASPGYRFAHSLIRNAIYDGLAPAERARIHRLIAEALEELHGADADSHLDVIAHHFSEAHGPETIEKAIDYTLRASLASYNHHAYDRSGSYARAALGMMKRAAPNPARRAKLLLDLANDLLSTVPEMIAYLETALPLFESLGQTKNVAITHMRLGSLLSEAHRGCLDLPRAMDHFDKAEALLTKEADLAILMELYHHKAVVCFPTMETKKGRDLTLRAMEMCEQLGDEFWWAMNAAIHTRFLVGLGQLAEADSVQLKAREKAERLQDVYTGPLLAWHGGINCSDLWDMRGALSGYLAELSTTRALWSPFRIPLLTESSHMYVQSGELAEARRVLAQMRGPGASTALPWEDGDWARNQSDIATKIELARRDGNLDSISLRTHWLGFMARMHGRYQESEAFQKESLEISRKAANLPRVLWAEQDLCLLYFDMRRREDARRSLQTCRNILAHGEDWKGIEGGVARAQAVVAALDRRFNEADTQFEKAVDIFRRYRASWFEAQTHRYWGRVLISAGDKRRATEKFQATIEIYRRIGAGQPWIDDVTAEMARLSTPKSASPPTVAVSGEGLCTFRREGEYWTLSYHGETFRLRDAKGLHYIVHLLRYPGRQVSSIELVALTSGGDSPGIRISSGVTATSGHLASDLGDAGEMLDPKAIAQYKRRREELRDEIDRAIRANDVGAEHRARAESDALSNQLSAATGVGGQLRKAASHRERARVRVNKRIQKALENIRTADPSLGRHLANSIQTGHSCCYAPAEPISWAL